MKYISLFFIYYLSFALPLLLQSPSENKMLTPVPCNPIDSLALVEFYNATSAGPCPSPGANGWTVDWNLNDNVCEWFGVTLNSSGRVTSLIMNSNGLTGNIPDDLSILTELEVLFLSNNCLTGSIPSSLGNLTKIKQLFLDGNELTGSIPPSLCNLTLVNSIFFDENNLTGTIPECFNNLDQLLQFDIFDNCIDSIPDLSGMLSMQPGKFKVQNNKLTFDDILPNLIDIGIFYNPQDSVCVELDVTLMTGTTYELSLNIDDSITTNSYQWYKDGVIFGAPTNSNTLVFDPVTFSTAGTYHCQVTNPNAPLLTLQSRAKVVNVICGTSTFNFTPDVCSGYEVVIGGMTFNQANPCFNNTLTGQDQYGCDSIINICLNFVTPTPGNLDTVLCAGESITINGTVFDESNDSGLVNFGVPDQFNCDSATQVNVTFFPPAISSYQPTICADDTVIVEGQAFHFSDSIGQVIIGGGSFHGCDSIINVDLDFFPIATSTFNGTYCSGQEVIINGTTYNEGSPDGTETILNGSWRGCDSIVIVDLTFGGGVTSTVDVSICEGQEVIVNGTTYDCDNLTGIETIMGGSFLGCDSIITVDLSCFQAPSGMLDTTLCSGESFLFNGTTYNSGFNEGEENLGGIGFNGCDSIVEVTLHFYPPAFSILDTAICENESIIIDGEEVDSNGPVIIENASFRGCDSTVFVTINFVQEITLLIDDVLCTGQSIVVNGEVYDEDNLTGEETIPGGAYNGCDSVIVVDISYGDAVINNVDVLLCEGDSLIVDMIVLDANNPNYSYTITAGSVSGCDSTTIYSVSYYPVSEAEFTPSLCPGESLVFGGVTIDENNLSDTIVITGASYTGCDSTIMVDATLLTIPTGAFSSTLCAGESIVINGTTYNESNTSGTETIPLGSFNGCDTTFTVLIDFYPEAINSIASTLCDGESLTVNGVLLNAANPSDTVIVPNASFYGCDSIVIINLDFYPLATDTIDYTLCFGQSIDVNGTTYNEGNPMGTETLTDSSFYGCDSIVIIDLTFNNAVMVTLDDIFCDPTQSIVVNNVTYDILTPSGTQTMLSSSGCDSIVTIDLTYPDSAFIFYNNTLCSGESLTVNGVVYDEDMPAGTEVEAGASLFGCDVYHVVDLSFYEVSEFFLNETLCAGEDTIIGGVLFDESHLTDTIVLEDAAFTNCDSFLIVTIDFYPEIIQNIDSTLCEGQVVVVNGNTYDINTPSGTEVMNSFTGCDSTVNINLTFGGAVINNFTDAICEGDSISINGTVYHLGNTMGSDTIVDGSFTGCDSVINIVITFIAPTYNNVDTILCPGEILLLNNIVYDNNNLSGTDTLFGESYTGCDSIINITLDYYPIAESMMDTTICFGESFVWNGQSYPPGDTIINNTITNGSYTGCDSTYIINVTQLEMALSEFDTILCSGDFFELHGTVFDENNVEEDILLAGQSFRGCDSTIHVTVGFHPLSDSMEEVAICEGDTLIWNGLVLTTAGLYQETLNGQSFEGCDSIVMLELTVLTILDLGLADAGSDMIICGDELMLDASNPSGTTGMWTIVSGDSDIDDPTQANAILNNIGAEEITLAWTLSSPLCPNYDSDTMVINAGIVPDALDDDYMPDEGITEVAISILDNDIYDNIDQWYFNILETPAGTLEELGDGQFTYTAPTDVSGGLIMFPYELCNEDCPDVCDTAMVRIQLQEEVLLEFPNTITANGDGVNDFFVIPDLVDFPDQFDQQELIIFNRWGDIVYSSKPYQNDWGGKTDSGKELPQGTYYYVLRLDVGQGIIYRGDVTILK